MPIFFVPAVVVLPDTKPSKLNGNPIYHKAHRHTRRHIYKPTCPRHNEPMTLILSLSPNTHTHTHTGPSSGRGG
jgi:hypothetical protein